MDGLFLQRWIPKTSEDKIWSYLDLLTPAGRGNVHTSRAETLRISSLTSNTQQWHLLNALIVQGPASSPASVIEPICAEFSLRMKRRAGDGEASRQWQRPGLAGLFGLTKIKNLYTSRVNASVAILSVFFMACLPYFKTLCPPFLSAFRCPTHSHLVQLQHRRCVDSSWQWRQGGVMLCEGGRAKTSDY